jgi:cytochrome c-type biogenesis protein CcmH/NrfG
MGNEVITASAARENMPATRVYLMAAICLVVGLGIGYVLRGPALPAIPATAVAKAAAPSAPVANPHGAMGAGHMPSLEEMKKIADKQAAPLLEKLKGDPKNSDVLVQVGAVYHSSHQFKEAAVYYDKAVQIEPTNVAVRTKLASSLFRSGDVDGAIGQLNKALTYDPKDANCLFDLGMIRWQGKQDGKGALAAWRELLKTNPQLSADRKATVRQLITDVQTTMSGQHKIQGVASNDGPKSNSN